jgi:hypothetical protein
MGGLGRALKKPTRGQPQYSAAIANCRQRGHIKE